MFSQSIGHKQQLSLAWSSSHKHQAYQHQLSPSTAHCTPLFCTLLSILALAEHFNHFPLPTTIVATSSSFLRDILRRLVSVVSLKHNSTHRIDELPLGALGSCYSSVHSEMKWHVPSNKLQGLMRWHGRFQFFLLCDTILEQKNVLWEAKEMAGEGRSECRLIWKAAVLHLMSSGNGLEAI